jgi:hypothetical protein
MLGEGGNRCGWKAYAFACWRLRRRGKQDGGAWGVGGRMLAD